MFGYKPHSSPLQLRIAFIIMSTMAITYYSANMHVTDANTQYAEVVASLLVRAASFWVTRATAHTVESMAGRVTAGLAYKYQRA
jgi:hypothetical protein